MTRKWFVLVLVLTMAVVFLGISASPAQAQSSYVTYVVQPGDTLGKIAYRYCTTWKDIYNINRDTIGSNPNVIQAGMALTVPANCDRGDGSDSTSGSTSGVYDRGPQTHASGVYRAPYYTVAWGDTLSSIGQRFGVPWQEIATTNGIKGTRIYAGQTLLIPTDGGVATPPPDQAPAERVYFQPGSISDTRSGVINQGIPKSFILSARVGQTMIINTVSHGEPLFITVANTQGELQTLSGVNSQINNSISMQIPATGDYIVTVSPLALPESPSLVFDITFIIQ